MESPEMSTVNLSADYTIRPKTGTQKYITKRAHKKSRGGCQGCKKRKIKCNEAQPQCSFCQTRNIECVYAHRTSSSTSGSPRQPPSSESGTPEPQDFNIGNTFGLQITPRPQLCGTTLSNTDLRLMHHFLKFSSSTIFGMERPGIDHILLVKVPRLAMQHEYMMHCILGVAALHLRHLAPHVQEYQLLTVVHRFKALRGLSDAISASSKEDHQAILLTSLFILVLAADRTNKLSDDDLWITGWLGLWAGMKEMIKIISWQYLLKSNLEPIFARDLEPLALANLPTFLYQMLQTLDPEDVNSETIGSTIKCLAKLYESLLFEGLHGRLLTKIVAWPANTDIFKFSALVKQRHPEALVLAAYYLVFTQLLEIIWWMNGVSDREIVAIAAALPFEYQWLMEVPLQATQLQNRQDIADLLLSQYPNIPSFDPSLMDVGFPFST